MKDPCPNYQDQIVASLHGQLPAGDARALEEHLASCVACSAYYQALQADDLVYREFSEMMTKRLDQIERQVIQTLETRSATRRVRPVFQRWRVRPSLSWAAAAAALALVLGGLWLIRQTRPEPTESVPVRDQAKEDSPAGAPSEMVAAQDQGTTVQQMLSEGDIDGLITLLEQSPWDVKLLAAAGLEQIGDARALPALAKFSAQWQGPMLDNPYARAIEAIQGRLRQPEDSSTTATSKEPNQLDAGTPVETTASTLETPEGVQGQVVNRQGIAVEGAQVVLYHNLSGWGLGNRVAEQTVTDGQGRYRFAHQLSSGQGSPSRSEWILQALHPDYAFGWKNIPNGRTSGSFRVTLTEAVPHTIRVTDLDGEPVAGALVWCYNAGTHESPDPLFRDSLFLPTDTGLVNALTDTDGYATVTNLPRTTCSFHADLDGFAQGLAFGSQETIHLTLGATVHGRLITPEGRGVEGATMTLQADWGHWSFWKALTDREGYFTLKDLPADGWDMSPWGAGKTGNGTYVVTLDHPTVALTETRLHLEQGQILHDYLLEGHSGMVLVECRVIASDTKEPMVGARISGQSQSGRVNGYTDANGVLTCRVVPGEMNLFFHSPPPEVYVLEGGRSSQRFEASGARMQVTLIAPPLAGRLVTIEGVILGTDGQALSAEAMVNAAAAQRFDTATAGNYIRPVSVDDTGLFQLKQVPAGLGLRLYAESKDHRYAVTATYDISKDPNDTPFLELTLLPTETAQTIIQYDDGDVMANRDITVSPMVEGQWLWTAERKCRTDAQGELLLDGVIPGLTYNIRDEEAFENRRQRSAEGDTKPAEIRRVLIPLSF